MKTPDTPQDEQARLEALWALSILDTVPEERFDRLTRMAKRLFSVPIALVSLVDEHRQWFKSCAGLNATETAREISFCGHAILGDEVFVIRNAEEDQRFADNPLVVNDPNIRFYAGCPLRAPNGHKVGTLCIIDLKPRDFDQEEVEALKDLASFVERELAAVQLATLDELTSISNRRGFMMLALHSLRLSTRHKIPMSLIFLDLDKLKPINDTFGHAEGDLALIAFATQIKNVFRESDIIARMGGDEFVVLLTNARKKQAGDIVARLLQSLEKYNREANRGYDIAFSYGIVEFDPETHRTAGALLADGDARMYELKKSQG